MEEEDCGDDEEEKEKNLLVICKYRWFKEVLHAVVGCLSGSGEYNKRRADVDELWRFLLLSVDEGICG